MLILHTFLQDCPIHDLQFFACYLHLFPAIWRNEMPYFFRPKLANLLAQRTALGLCTQKNLLCFIFKQFNCAMRTQSNASFSASCTINNIVPAPHRPAPPPSYPARPFSVIRIPSVMQNQSIQYRTKEEIPPC